MSFYTARTSAKDGSEMSSRSAGSTGTTPEEQRRNYQAIAENQAPYRDRMRQQHENKAIDAWNPKHAKHEQAKRDEDEWEKIEEKLD